MIRINTNFTTKIMLVLPEPTMFGQLSLIEKEIKINGMESQYDKLMEMMVHMSKCHSMIQRTNST